MLSWGLPVSVLSPLGNALFSPFIVLFLALSMGISGAEMMHIPHQLLDLCLEGTAGLWFKIMQLAPPGLLLILHRPPFLLALCAPLGTILIMHSRMIRGLWRKLGSLCALFALLTAIFALLPPDSKLVVPCVGKRLTIYRNTDGSLIAFDPGCAPRSAGVESWLSFTLLPQLSIHFGRQQIDRYVCRRLTPAAAILLTALCKKRVIRTLCLPPVKRGTSKKDKKMREELIALARMEGVVVR
jgi:hypothetical protein